MARGYRLSVDPLAVDLHRFRHLVRQARSADAPTAATLYDQALELWRGEPLAGIDTPWFAGVRSSLQAERLAAELDRNDAALRAGRHADLLGPLAAALREHPLDERLTGQLMLAQFRSGRQADALDTYRRLRGRLRDELGADPGSALRAVHQQILAGDADASRGLRAAPSRPRPAPGAGPGTRPRPSTRWSAPNRCAGSTGCGPRTPGGWRWSAVRPGWASRRWSRRSRRGPGRTCGCSSAPATRC